MRLSIRHLIRRPALAFVIVGTLTIALAFMIASLSILNGLLLHPYPYPKLHQVLLIRDSKPTEGVHQRRPIAIADFMDVRQAAAAFTNVAGWRPRPLVVTDAAGEPERVEALAVTANFFETLGVTPMLGRRFAPDADRAGHDDVVVISRRLWRSRFGADPSLVGRAIALNNRPTTVIGVVRDEDCYLPGIDAWVPLVLTPPDLTERAVQRIYAFGRLADRATQPDAEAQLLALSGTLSLKYPLTNRGRGFELMPLQREQYEFTAPLFLFVQAAALLVLAIAIVNVLNLLVGRTLERRHELTVRSMLGAATGHITVVATAEAMVLALAATVCGALLAGSVLRAIRVSLPEGIARWFAGWSSLRVDSTSLAAGLALGLLVTLAIVGVLALAGLQLARSNDRDARTPRGSTLVRRSIVAAEVGLAAALLLGASMMVAGLAKSAAAFASLSPAQLLRFTLTLPESRYPDETRVAAFHTALLDAIHELPEVDTAALMRNGLASNVASPVVTIQREDAPPRDPNDPAKLDLQAVSPELFSTLRLDVLAGRSILADDGASAPRVGVVSREAAQRFWQDRDPIGSVISVGADPRPLRIVGMVSDFRLNWFDPAMRPVLYVPDAQAPARTTTVVVRARTDPMLIARPIRAAIARLDSRQPIAEMESVTTTITDSLSPLIIVQRVLLVAAALAVFLAAVGVYSVIVRWVGWRARELGVRSALGATRRGIMYLVMREALLTAVVGAGAGVVLAALAAQGARGVLLGVPSLDSVVVLTVVGGVVIITLAAALGPARRAARIDIARLLRLD